MQRLQCMQVRAGPAPRRCAACSRSQVRGLSAFSTWKQSEFATVHYHLHSTHVTSNACLVNLHLHEHYNCMRTSSLHATPHNLHACLHGCWGHGRWLPADGVAQPWAYIYTHIYIMLASWYLTACIYTTYVDICRQFMLIQAVQGIHNKKVLCIGKYSQRPTCIHHKHLVVIQSKSAHILYRKHVQLFLTCHYISQCL